MVVASYKVGATRVEAPLGLGLKKAYDEDFDAKNNVSQVVVGYTL